MSDSLENKFDEFMSSFDNRLRNIEKGLSETRFAQERRSEDSIPPALGLVGASNPPFLSSATGATSNQPDLQAEFQSLKDSLSKVKIPAELRLNDSRQGIKRSDQPLLNVIVKCGRYCETGIKLLGTLEAGSSLDQETLDNLFLIHHAQVKYLQEEFAALLVNGQFDTSTAKIFRSLQRNTSGFDQTSLETLRSAATLAAAGRSSGSGDERGRRGQSYFYGRGRGRGSFSYRQDRDVFQSFANRQFPNRRQPREDNSNVQGSESI
jgi:hypothetical protein